MADEKKKPPSGPPAQSNTGQTMKPPVNPKQKVKIRKPMEGTNHRKNKGRK
jgi:hypothetical protein